MDRITSPTVICAGDPAQRVAAFGSAAAPYKIHPLQDLHDLKEEFHRDGLPLSDVLNADGRFRVVVQRQLQDRGARILISCRNLHNSHRRYPRWTSSVTLTDRS
jgi:hypothetical protein